MSNLDDDYKKEIETLLLTLEKEHAVTSVSVKSLVGEELIYEVKINQKQKKYSLYSSGRSCKTYQKK